MTPAQNTYWLTINTSRGMLNKSLIGSVGQSFMFTVRDICQTFIIMGGCRHLVRPMPNFLDAPYNRAQKVPLGRKMLNMKKVPLEIHCSVPCPELDNGSSYLCAHVYSNIQKFRWMKRTLDIRQKMNRISRLLPAE